MKVRIVDGNDQTIWERGKDCGIACQSYVHDGTQQTIIEILTDALRQAKGELAVGEQELLPAG